MSLLGRVFRNTENLLHVKTWALAVSWNEGLYFSKKVVIPVPAPPKRPLTAYMLFVKEQRKELLKENPVLSNTEQIRVLAKKWVNLNNDSKKPYEVLARESTLLYGEAHKKYYENLSHHQLEELNKQKSEKRKARRMYRLNKALRESGLPKQAKSSYALFVHSLRSDDKNSGGESRDFLKQAAEKWKSLSEDEKKSFEKEAAHDKVRYSMEITEWREKLMKEGNEKLLKEFAELKRRGKPLMADETDKNKTKKSSIKIKAH